MTIRAPATVACRNDRSRIGTVVNVNRTVSGDHVDVLWSNGELRFQNIETVVEVSPLELLAVQGRLEEDEDIRRLLAERARYRELLILARECLRDQLQAAYYKNETYMHEVFLRLDAALSHDPEGDADEEVDQEPGWDEEG